MLICGAGDGQRLLNGPSIFTFESKQLQKGTELNVYSFEYVSHNGVKMTGKFTSEYTITSNQKIFKDATLLIDDLEKSLGAHNDSSLKDLAEVL